MYENFDLENIIPLIWADALHKLLVENSYDSDKMKFLVNGFSQGFSIQYNGNTDVGTFAPNLKLRVGNKMILWNKVMKEVKAKHFAGPYVDPPFENFFQSLIGLVDKDWGRDTRLIFHLSYPRTDHTSVNVNTPDEFRHVKYIDFDEAIVLCLWHIQDNEQQVLYLGKSNFSRAFRNVGLSRSSWQWLILKAESPLDGKIYYFVDKCLTFGHTISCAIFQDISDVIPYLVQIRISAKLINYLDDYLFMATLWMVCNQQIQGFIDLCKEINMPVSSTKTFWAEEAITLLGFVIETHGFGTNREVGKNQWTNYQNFRHRKEKCHST